METKITNDALQLINSHLSPASRLNLASLDDYFFDICTSWRDVKTIIFDDENITLGSPLMVHQFHHHQDSKSDSRTPSLKVALEVCPSLKRLIIQTTLRPKDVEVLTEKNVLITKLYVSTENLNCAQFPTFSRLRTLHIVANSVKQLKIMNVIGNHILTAAFPTTLRRLCLTDVYLTENLMLKIERLPNLISLDLIGCIVDTNVGAKYISNIEKCQKLEELSLPPSMFSFTSSKKHNFSFDFRNLKVEKLSLYMDSFDEQTFAWQVSNSSFFHKKLLVLVVFGNFLPLKRWKGLKDVKKLKIIFGPNESIASCPQANLINVKLLSHLVRRPPYIVRDYSSRLNHVPEISLESLSWKFNLVEWQSNETLAMNETTSRRRADVLMGGGGGAHEFEFIFGGGGLDFPALAPAPPHLNNEAAMTTTTINPPRTETRAQPAVPRNRRGRGGGTATGLSRSAPQIGGGGGGRRRGRLNDAPPTMIPIATTSTAQTTNTDSMRTNPPSPPPSAVTTTTTNLTSTPIIREITDQNEQSSVLNRTLVATVPTVDNSTNGGGTATTQNNLSEASITTSSERLPTTNQNQSPRADNGAQVAPNDEQRLQMIVETLAQVAAIVLPTEAELNMNQNSQQQQQNQQQQQHQHQHQQPRNP